MSYCQNNLNIAQVNICSLTNKVDEVRLLLDVCRFDILAIIETHLDSSISDRQLEIENYKLFRKDRKGRQGGGCLVYITNSICSSRLKSLETPEIEQIWLKVTTNSKVFVLGTIYRPPSYTAFFDHFDNVLENVWVKYKNIVIVGDFNCDFTSTESGTITSPLGNKLHSSLAQLNFVVVNNQPTRVTGRSSTLIDLVVTNNDSLIKHTNTLDLGISDHLLVYAAVRTKIRRPPPKIIRTRNFKRFNSADFIRDIELAPWSVCSVFDNADDSYWAWQKIFGDICNEHAPYRDIKLRRQSLPWVNPNIRHKMNLRLRTLRKARQTNDPETWARYKELRNQITSEVRVAKCNYFKELFDEVKDCRTYWNLIKRNTEKNRVRPILGIRKLNGTLEITDTGKANILNEYFSTIGEKLANECLASSVQNQATTICRITPTIMNIDLSQELFARSLKKLKTNKASGPDKVSSKLLKLAGSAILPSLMTVYRSSAITNQVPDLWKKAKVSAIYKKEDDMDKNNYRPISLLCLPRKVMESSVASTITSHTEQHGLNNQHQWAYKKGHSTELLMVKMTEDWRRALDNKQVVGVIFVDLRKAFDSISHPLLLNKLQGVGIAGDIWLWIQDYLSNRRQFTVVNGCDSKQMTVKFGVPQGSVLGPILFSLFCNDLPDIADDEDDTEIEMYADDTTIYVIGPTTDVVTMRLNEILSKFCHWCSLNSLTPHPGKTEFMLMGNKSFVGPIRGIMLGKFYIKRVHSTRCLGMEVDDELKWVKHASELTRSFSQKINLLKSLYFLPTKARLDFYHKVIYPSITYGLIVWGSCNKTLFSGLESIHVRAAKIIFGLDWNTPTKDVLTKYNWKTLKDTYLEELVRLVHKCYYGISPVPIQGLFLKRPNVYNLRKQNCLSLPRPRTEMMKKSITYKGCVLWNNLDNKTRELEHCNRFKLALKYSYLSDQMFE